MNSKIKIAVVGMNFGAQFIPCYLYHPDVASVAICDTNQEVLAAAAKKFKIEKTFTDLDTLLKSDEYDAVHLVTPITVHARQSIAVLGSGRHCACAIPMGLSIDELKAIIAAKNKSNKNFMMMETAVYTRAYLKVKEMYQNNEFGRIQFLRCAHYQDMEGWPHYWMGFPPLMHPTHALGPCLDLIGKRPLKVYGLGSGFMRKELVDNYGNPFPVESALIKLRDSDVAIEVTRSMFHTTRGATECFNVYGEKATFEWQQIEEELPVLFRENQVQYGDKIYNFARHERIDPPDRGNLLPKEVARFTQRTKYDEADPDTFMFGGGHWGSHPHLAHEFVRSIVENRKPSVDEIDAAYWTGAGICAHESAMNGGAEVLVPDFDIGG